VKNIEQFFEMARERQQIYLKREAGEPAPWTEDRVLRNFRFCNIFREKDKTTIWFRENIRDPLKDDPKVLLATMGFRWFNLISTGELIKDVLLEEGWNSEKILSLLDGKSPLVTGAYIIKTPNGRKKLPGICECMDVTVSRAQRLLDRRELTPGGLQWFHRELLELPYMGPFMAYEVVTDLRFTYLLENAQDTDKWASAGPGCARGLGWLASDNPERYSYTSAAAQQRMLGLMVEILECSRHAEYWPPKWPRWEMREVEHTLCEYDKWRRGRKGQRLKRIFNESDYCS